MDVIGTDVTSRCHGNRYISIQRHNIASLLVPEQPIFFAVRFATLEPLQNLTPCILVG